ncbi:MAG: ATP-dependent DNA helicase RecG [Actinomycetota bacterium]|nr:ATP-dependent DNA helicase RecG [Actinomycetota bacterium]
MTVLSGVGPARAAKLADLGIVNVADLLTHYPRRCVDRSRQASLAELRIDEEATVVVRVDSVGAARRVRGRAIVEMVCSDASGSLKVTFFNQSWRARQLHTGMELLLFGKLEAFRGRRQMTNPLVDLVGDRCGGIIPVYPASEKAGITSWEVAVMVQEAVRRAGRMADPLPPAHRRRLSLLSRTEALAAIHQPESMDQWRSGRRRLAFDELLRLQCALVGRRVAARQRSDGIAHTPLQDRQDLWRRLAASLPFGLTSSQARAIAEIGRDMESDAAMHRLLQGDVGSGKTLVAVAAMLVALRAGHQAALMAPTEVLAEQHYLSIRSLIDGFDVPDASRLGAGRPLQLGLLSSRVGSQERSKLLAQLAVGAVDILVGTHALLVDDVRFASLGLAVIDEQHRFGVDQRSLLRAKGSGGRDPDLLVMTATPIPRTAAMTVYGDLDMTVMTDLPAGRSPVTTVWARDDDQVASVWDRVRREVAFGHQAFVVCPLVDGSESVEAASVEDELRRLEAGELSGLRLALLHGQMPQRAKQAAMTAFRGGEADVLVATTVVEVGVDVPAATVMVVLDAHRFGMAQLHQLRGRVGRSELASWCYLVSRSDGDEAAQRLSALESSTDGFFLADRDLQIRGEGTLLGTRQQGRSDLRLASFTDDRELVAEARRVAVEIVDQDPALSAHPVLAAEVAYFVGEQADFLLKS